MPVHPSPSLLPSDHGAPRVTPLADARVSLVEELLDAAFGADRHGRTAYRLREGARPIADLSFAVFAGAGSADLLACLQCWPVALVSPAGQDPMILVGPVAVAPSVQSLGLGTRLMTRLIAALDQNTRDHGAITPQIMIGDPDYYGRFGFTATDTGGWALPGPVERHRLLARGSARLPRTGVIAPCPLSHHALSTPASGAGKLPG